jgi:hypothetical protein
MAIATHMATRSRKPVGLLAVAIVRVIRIMVITHILAPTIVRTGSTIAVAVRVIRRLPHQLMGAVVMAIPHITMAVMEARMSDNAVIAIVLPAMVLVILIVRLASIVIINGTGPTLAKTIVP